MAPLRAGRRDRVGSRDGHIGGLPAAGRHGLSGRARSGRARLRRIGGAPRQPLRQPQPIASVAPRLGRQPQLRDRARRRDRRRRPSDSRPHRLPLQHASGRGDVEGERLLRSGTADAGARHRAGRPDHRRVGRLARRRPCRRSSRAGADRPGQAARARRLLERRRTRPEIRAGRGRARQRSTVHAARADLPDDRRPEICVDGASHQPPRSDPLFREGPVARRHARVQPLQVQLVSRERGPAIVAGVYRRPVADPPPRKSRPAESVCRR